MAAAELRRSHGSERYVSDIQRGRLLDAIFALVGEAGYEAVSARRVSERAGVSNRTFYESFTDREDCFLAAFNYAVEGLEREARVGWESEPGWVAGVRAALALLLRALDREPAVSRLVFVEALGAGSRVLARRARVLESLAGVVDQGRENGNAPSNLPPLVAEGIVGGAFGVIHARLLELRPEPLIGLLGALMAMIVLPYRGSEAAARELTRPVPRSPMRRRDGDGVSRRALGSASPVDYRLTARTQKALAHKFLKQAKGSGRRGMTASQAGPDSRAAFRMTVLTHTVLTTVATLSQGESNPSNREVAQAAGVKDQGQISKLLARLQTHGLLENSGGLPGVVNAWRLTSRGEQLLSASSPVIEGVGR